MAGTLYNLIDEGWELRKHIWLEYIALYMQQENLQLGIFAGRVIIIITVLYNLIDIQFHVNLFFIHTCTHSLEYVRTDFDILSFIFQLLFCIPTLKSLAISLDKNLLWI